MKKSAPMLTTALSALAIAFATIAISAPPVSGQTAKKLKCTGCVKSKQLKNGQVKNADLRKNAVSGAKVRDNSLSGTDIRDGSIGPADLAPGTALGLSGIAVVPATAFHGGSTVFINFSEGYVSAVGSNAPVGAPVYLPHGAIVERVVAHVWDDDAAFTPGVSLHRTQSATGDTDTLASLAPPQNGPFVQELETVAIDFPTVDLVTYHYWASMPVKDEWRLYAVRVFYR